MIAIIHKVPYQQVYGKQSGMERLNEKVSYKQVFESPSCSQAIAVLHSLIEYL